MANIAPELNFRIGADIKGINKAIREAEKSFRSAVSSFSNIGNSLSLAISAPLAAFSALSVKAAGDMENLRFALEGTMKDAGRTVEEARLELEALRQAALAPGLDFEQAVKGSVRLQSVGIQAEKARQIIVQLANALALSGGTADQLDGVTKQFTQMIGKGKILQEDISIILENMPALANVMRKEFGQTTAEGLTKARVSVEQFISRLTKGMEELPRAQGGIANSIVNAQTAIKQAIAQVGEEINKTFNVSGALNTFAGWVAGLGTWFKNLDESTKRAIGAVAVFAATLGPAFKVMQGGVYIVGQLHTLFLSLQKTLAQSLAGQALPSLIAKWKALDLAMKTSVIGATVAVVLALAAAFAVFSKDMSAAAQAARKVEEVNRSAADSVAEQKAKVELLTGTLKNNTASLESRKAALKELQAISPEYFGNLDAEKSKISDIDRAMNGYVSSILRAAKAKAAFDQIVEIDKQLNKLAETAEPTFWQQAWNVVTSGGNSLAFAAENARDFTANMAQSKTALEAQKTALAQVIKENTDVVASTKAVTAATKEATAAAKEHSEALNPKDFSKPGNFAQLPTLATPDAIMSENDPMRGIAESTTIAAAAMTNYLSVGEQVGQINAQMQSGAISLSAAMQQLGQVSFGTGMVIENIAVQVGNALALAAEQGAASLGELAKASVSAAAKIIRAYIQQGVAAAAMKALAGVPFPFNIAAAAAAGAIASTLFNALIKSVGIPALAGGGLAMSPTLAVVGDNPGARANPEVIAPLDRLQAMLDKRSGEGGGTLTARVSGDDLLFILERAKYKNNRAR